MPTLTVTYPDARPSVTRCGVPARAVILATLLSLAFVTPAVAQPPSCEDTLRAAMILNETRAQTLQQTETQAARTMADLVKRIETLQRENADLKAKVDKGATPAGVPKEK